MSAAGLPKKLEPSSPAIDPATVTEQVIITEEVIVTEQVTVTEQVDSSAPAAGAQPQRTTAATLATSAGGHATAAVLNAGAAVLNAGAAVVEGAEAVGAAAVQGAEQAGSRITPGMLSWVKGKIIGFPRMIANEYAGMGGRIAGLYGLFQAWTNFGAPLFAKSTVIKPLVTGLIAAAFPAAFVSSELVAAVVTAQNLENALLVAYLFDKGLGGGYYKRGKDAGKDWARKYFGITKEYPAGLNRWSWEGFKFNMKSLAVDLCGMANGFRYVTGGVGLAVIAANVAMFKVLGGLPILGAITNTLFNVATGLGKFIYGCVGFALSLVVTKEVADLAGDWGNDLGIGISNLAFDTANYAAESAVSGARKSYNAVATSSVGTAGAYARDSAYNGAVTVSEAMRAAANNAGAGILHLARRARSTTQVVDPGAAPAAPQPAANQVQAPALAVGGP